MTRITVRGTTVTLAIALAAAWSLASAQPASSPPGTHPISAAQQHVPPDDEQSRRLPDAWMGHYNAGDPVQVAALYAEDAYYLSAHVLAHGLAATQAYWTRGIAAGGHIDAIEPLLVSSSGSFGHFVGRYQATNAGMTVDGRILIVVKKVRNEWLIAAHQTVVRDQP